jgi:hypothetical protein
MATAINKVFRLSAVSVRLKPATFQISSVSLSSGIVKWTDMADSPQDFINTFIKKGICGA